MCSAFTPDCGYDNSIIILIGDVSCPNTNCSGRLCRPERLFNLSAEAIINARNVGLCARCAKFFLKVKQIPFSCRLVKGFTFLKRAQNQFKMLLEMFIVLASIYDCGICGACLFVHKVPLMLQEHVKTTQTDKTRFFFSRKR